MDIGPLRKEDYTVWVPFMEDAEVLVRHVTTTELVDINREATVASWDMKSSRSESLDAALAARLLGRAAVRGWRGITMDGEEFPYSTGNCDFLMSRWPEFSRFINSASTGLAALAAQERRHAEKKSSLTSGRASTTRV